MTNEKPKISTSDIDLKIWERKAKMGGPCSENDMQF
jgi:hypothetical protein